MSIAPNVGGLSRSGRARELLRVARPRATWGRSTATTSTRCCRRSTAAARRAAPRCCTCARARARGYRAGRGRPVPLARDRAVRARDRRAARRRRRRRAELDRRLRRRARSALADRDPRVVAITAAMPDGTGLDRFARRHPDRMLRRRHRRAARRHLRGRARGRGPAARCARSTRPSCSAPSTRSCTTSRCRICPSPSRSTARGWSAPTARPTTACFDLAYLRIDPEPRGRRAARRERARSTCSRPPSSRTGPFALRFPRGDRDGRARSIPDPKPLAIGRGELLRDGGDVALVGDRPARWRSR